MSSVSLVLAWCRRSLLQSMFKFDAHMKCGTISFFVLLQLVVNVFSTTLDNDLQTLKAQVNALLQRRQEDYNQLEESLRKTLDKNTEISSLKSEIQELRAELQILKSEQGANAANSNRAKNEQLTVQWLSSSVVQIRSEMSELARSFNSTVELQQQQSLSTDISILQNDVVTLRHDFQVFKGDFAKAIAKLSSVTQDVEVSRQLSHSTATLVANLTAELQVAVLEWSRNTKSTQKKDKVFKRMVVVNEDPLDLKVVATASGGSRYRHNRAIVKQLHEMKSTINELLSSYKRFKHQLLNLEERSVSNKENELDSRFREEFETRVSKVENLSQSLNESVGLLNTQIAGQEKLHTSMLELLEAVENIETKVDSTTPDLKREISKLEFNLAQITSTISLLKEDQNNQRVSMKALGEGLSSIQDKMANYQSQIANLSSHISSCPPSSSIQPIQQTEIELASPGASLNSVNIENIFHQLSTIHWQYSSIVNHLPKDCNSVIGNSGLYLVTLDGGDPVLVYCEIQSDRNRRAYTVIQRRINGTQDFNKNWQEYAHGFGSLSGEFWLGNEVIHRLTKNNDTSLRIDFKDVFGAMWYAEYNEFSVASRDEGYKLHVTGYSGNASDALEYQNRMQFSTVDSDRDISNTNCAANYEGGWWFSHCQHTNLNGKYNLGLTWFDQSRNEWIAVALTEIKLFKK